MSLVKPEVITVPFCGDGVAGQDYIVPPISAGDTSVVTQNLGWQTPYELPIPNGGVAPERTQQNGAFYLYSSILVWMQAGGTFTFEQTVSDANNGYPKGTVLAYTRADASHGFLYSSVDNNTDNFITTPSSIGTTWHDIGQASFPDIIDLPDRIEIGGIRYNQVVVVQSKGTQGALSSISMVGDANTASTIVKADNGTVLTDLRLSADDLGISTASLRVLTEATENAIAFNMTSGPQSRPWLSGDFFSDWSRNGGIVTKLDIEGNWGAMPLLGWEYNHSCNRLMTAQQADIVDSGSNTIYFPQQFSAPPVVVLTITEATNAVDLYITNNTFNDKVIIYSNSPNCRVNIIAIGMS